MKPLFPIVVAILVVAATAHPENIEDVKELPQSKEPIVEAEASAPQARKERCTTCSHSLKSQNELFQALKSLPNAEVHTQETFEGCSSEKGCAGIKKVDGAVIEKFGNLQALNGAASAGVPNTPFWWMNQQNSPFKAGAAAAGGAGGGSFEKFSKSSSSFTSSSTGGAGGVDLGANPFLNGEFAKLGAGFNGASNFGSSQSEIDITKNQFLNGQAGFNGQSAGAFGGASQSGANSAFGSQSGGAFGSGSQSAFGSKAQGFGSSSQTGFGASGQGVALSQGAQGAQGFGASQNGFNSFNAAGKFGSGYSGSSPAPFTPTGSNVNLIQNSQKNEFDYTQQQQTQQNIDEVFQSTGNVQAHESSGGDLQQTCAGQGYVCVLKSQCNNGVVNTNGGGLLQANTQKQYCNTRTEICCRIETASLAGAGNLQGSLGVGSATYSGNQGLFGQSASASNQNSFGATGFGSNQASNSAFGSNQASNTAFGSANRGSSAFGSNQFGASGSFGTNKFASTTGTGFGSTIAPNRNVNNEVFKSTSQTNFVETDSFSSGSDNSGIYRPGAIGTVLKPGIPYLPPVDTSSSGSNVVSTAYTPAFVTTPRPFTTPRPITTQRVYSTPKPTYLPPISTKAPEYLPPVDGYTASDSFPHPSYIDGQLILDENLPGTVRPPPPAVFNDVPSGCAAALKCTPIEFCTADGVVSNTTVILSRDQEAYRVPLTDCKDLESGRIGKCCRDPYYTDPWPVNQLGKWVPGVFGGNDGTYTPDNRGSPNNPPRVTVRPPTTGTIIKDFFPEPTPTPTYYAGGRSTYQGGQGLASTGQNAFASNIGKKAFSQGTGLTSFSNGAQNTNAFAQGTQNAFSQTGTQNGFAQNANAFSRGTQNGLGFSTAAQNTNTLSRGTQNGLGISQGTQNTNAFSRGTQNSLNGFSQGGLNTNTLSRGSQTGVTSFNQGQNTNSLSRGVQNSLTGTSLGAQNANAFSRGVQNTNTLSQGAQTGATGFSAGAQNTNAFRGTQNSQAGFSQGAQNTNTFSRGAQSGIGISGGQAGLAGSSLGVQNTNAVSRGAQNSVTGFAQGAQNSNAFSRGAQSGVGLSGGAQTNAFGQGVQTGLAGSSQGVQNTNAFSRGAQSGSGFSGGAQSGLGFSGGAQGNSGFAGGAQGGSGFSGGAQSGSGFGGGAQGGSGFSGGAQSGSGFGGGAQSGSGFSGGAQSGSGFGGGAQGGSGFSGGAQGGSGFGGGAQSGAGFGGGAQSGLGFSGGAQNSNSISRGVQNGLAFGAQNAFSGGAQLGFGQGAQKLVSGVQQQESASKLIKQEKIVEEGGFGERRTGGFKVEKGQRGELEEGGFGVKRTGGFNVERGQRTEIEEGGLGVKRTGGFKVEKGQRGEIEEGAFGVKRTGGFNVEKGQRTEIEEGGFGIKRTGGFGLERGELTEIERRKLFKIQQEQSQENGLSYGNEASESIQRVFLKRYQSNGECGLQNPQRPYGNHKDLELDFAEIPWQAMILLQTNKSLLCGGVITRPDVVITSASCVEGLDARNVLIKGGEWKLGIDDEPLPFQIVQVKHILRHPGFVAGSLKNDAAILVLTENLRLAKNIWPICLPSSTDAFDAFYNGAGKCIVTGWGKSVLQAHLEGSIIHGLNVSLLNPGQCENKISQDYPHLRDLYDQESCACGQPTNPTNNICKVDIGSAIACTTDDSHYVLRGIYSWDSGCQVGNQLAGFYKFDLEWYEWAIGLIESVRFSQYTVTTTITKKQFGVASTPGVKGTTTVRKTVTTGFQPGSTITGISGIAGATKTSGIQGSYNSGFNAGITGATKTSGLQGSVTTVTNQKVITTGASGINSGLNGGFGVTGISGASKTSGIQGAFNSGFNSGITGATKTSGVQGSVTTVTNKKIITTGVSGGGAFGGNAGISGNSGFQQTVTGFGTGGQSKSGGFSQFGAAKYDSELTKLINSGEYQEIKSPVEKTFSTYSRQFVQTQPEVTYVTLKPVVKTFEYTKVIPIETKTEYFKLPTKRTEFTYTKPEIRYDYQTSGSQTNQQIVAPSVSFTPSFSEVTGTKHIHDAKCKCLENGKK
ncbi:uncharacterized protein LOC113498549 isoform X2 [Trichoplusia ni]|uniref:Uncharacterized protein LOC113498549 isoform X2 n=1 Tax=Trichoplusia ni TaxID=7111 RepID=A0A7E5W195_TRINI|nr:uncharacterized protein LOC113498549 isoform X2 [Trichoplusia ni]